MTINRRTMFGRFAFALAALTFPVVTPLDAQVSSDRDGNWWNLLDENSRLFFVLGFMDGMHLGNDFSFWDMTDQQKKAYLSPLTSSYTNMSQRYLSTVVAGQIRDGLNEFYADYRNRSILAIGAIWLVLQGIAGIPKDPLDQSIESWRKNAHHIEVWIEIDRWSASGRY
jgi:hypothetical protein